MREQPPPSRRASSRRSPRTRSHRSCAPSDRAPCLGRLLLITWAGPSQPLQSCLRLHILSASWTPSDLAAALLTSPLPRLAPPPLAPSLLTRAPLACLALPLTPWADGIATNAALAAFAFAAAFNRIAILSAAHQVPPDEYSAKRQCGLLAISKGAYTSAARESYRQGLARGLAEAVRASKQRKELEQQKRLEMARAKASRGEAWQCSSDEDDDDDDGGGGGGGGGSEGGEGDEMEAVAVKTEAVAVKTKAGGESSMAAEGGEGSSVGAVKLEMTAADAVVKLEREQKAATALVAHTANIAKAFLAEAGVKLSHAKKTYTSAAFRTESYEQGKKDAQEIDINQRSLE